LNAYFDTSVVLRLLLGQSDALKDWSSYKSRIGSSLVEVESLRTLDRLRLNGGISEEQSQEYRGSLYEFLETLELVEPSAAILRRASGSFPTAIGTLDAIHLSTALAWQDERVEPLIVATHDTSFGKTARALGFKTTGF
jgi:predicted nucleic acid-binding protein